MRVLKHTLLILSCSGCFAGAMAQPAIGHWRDHLPYTKAIAVVEGGGYIHSATTSAVFRYNEQTGETDRLTKVNALSDVNITALGWNHSRSALVVGYKNGNLDIISGAGTTNVSDIRRSDLLGDKGVYCITEVGSLLYLGCGFGIVVYDLSRNEVKDTWLIGPNASQVEVNGIVFHHDSIEVATNTGLFSAAQNGPNLAAFTSWHKRTDIPHAAGPFTSVAAFNDRLFVNFRVNLSVQNETDTVYVQSNGGWVPLTEVYGQYNRQLRVSDDGQRLVITHKHTVREYDNEMTQVLYADHVGSAELMATDAIVRTSGGLWVSSETMGLVRYSGSDDFAVIHPNGPKNSVAYRMSIAKGALYVTTGAVSGTWGDLFAKDGVHHFLQGEWGTTDRDNDPLYEVGSNSFGGTVNDVMAVAVDPDDGNHAFIGSWDDGLLEMRNNHLTGFYGSANSSLQATQNSTSSSSPTQIAGLAYDDAGDLWVTNSNCSSPISVRKKSGSWKAFNPGAVLTSNTLLSDIIVGTNGYKWMLRPRSSGMLVFNDNGTIDDAGDDQYKALNTFEGQGKLPSMDVFSIAEDKDGQIWVGTGKGVAVFYDPDALFAGGNYDAQQILITQDGNVQILLETEAVSAILVDGANRKWLGTQTSGLFLVSADGTEQLAHFTAANSPLPSDNITCLAMDGSSGELFIGTDQGIMSYRGEATDESDAVDCATVFPNPVRETYTGPVAISGLLRDSEVRVTDIAGNIVYRTTSLGGQAIWPATDMSGRRVSTGVYMILASDPTGAYSCNTKVLVVH